ncbi:maleate cis-trans isomerase family protein [Ruania halotolerans]|uniref:maleate cis-trans isomerase family protein n=1 Tax=Ruania halotolerans TaxID=2897773 RepID=UPI001E483FA5|nr:maleate cis-trans isomerase [Ruania halotolerans]UFU07518.1 maleate cis-trans isomerase [Ruania halotolerans]
MTASATTETTIGFIYPDHAAEDDYPYAAELLRPVEHVRLEVTHIYGTDLHAVPELLDLGSPERLAAGAAQLAPASPDAVVWACTSGSFVYGPDGAREQVRQLASVAGVPASSTSFAFVHAAQALGLERVAVAASYPQDVAGLFADFLGAAGIEVLEIRGAGIDTAAEVGTLEQEAVLDLAAANDHPDAQALLIPDTAMHTLRWLGALEDRIGKPVLTANQVTIWEGLRLLGQRVTHPALGTLFGA